MPTELDQILLAAEKLRLSKEEEEKLYKMLREKQKEVEALDTTLADYLQSLQKIITARFSGRLSTYGNVYFSPIEFGILLDYNKIKYGARIESSSHLVQNAGFKLPGTNFQLLLSPSETLFNVLNNETPINLGEPATVKEEYEKYIALDSKIIEKMKMDMPKVSIFQKIRFSYIQQYRDVSYQRVTEKSIRSYVFLNTSFKIKLPAITGRSDPALITEIEKFLQTVEEVDSQIQQIVTAIYRGVYLGT